MASLSFIVNLCGAPPVSPVTRLSRCSGSQNDITFQIGWLRASFKMRKIKLICKVASGLKRPEDERNMTTTQPDQEVTNGLPIRGISAADDFCTGEKKGLVSIGSHRLFLQSGGPDRKPGEPVVILMPGVASSSKGFAAVFRLLKRFVRVYSYDRSGFGQSDRSSDKAPTSTTIVFELDLLLRNANVAPPYIFVGHSWGGMLSREFFALRPNHVAGMVLVDANQERTLEVLDWREPRLWSIQRKLEATFYEYTGQNKEHRLTEEEWRAYVDDRASRKHLLQSLKELKGYANSFPVLAEQAQLHRTPEPLMGDRPLSVVTGNQRRDWKRTYDQAVKEGQGTEEERAFLLDYLQRDAENHLKLQKELLSLSNNCRLVSATKSGHDVHLTQPEMIVDENMIKVLSHRVKGIPPVLEIEDMLLQHPELSFNIINLQMTAPTFQEATGRCNYFQPGLIIRILYANPGSSRLYRARKLQYNERVPRPKWSIMRNTHSTSLSWASCDVRSLSLQDAVA